MFESIINKVKEIRETNINRRESINRVKAAIKAQETGSSPDQIDTEAKTLSEKLNVSYKDALEYIQSEKKFAKRKESFKEITNFMSQIGQNAKADTARRYGGDQFMGGVKLSQPIDSNDSNEIQKMNNIATEMKQRRRKMLGME